MTTTVVIFNDSPIGNEGGDILPWEVKVPDWKSSRFLTDLVDDDEGEEVRVDVGMLDPSTTKDEILRVLKCLTSCEILRKIHETFHTLRNPQQIHNALTQMNKANHLKNMWENKVLRWLYPDPEIIAYARDICEISDRDFDLRENPQVYKSRSLYMFLKFRVFRKGVKSGHFSYLTDYPNMFQYFMSYHSSYYPRHHEMKYLLKYDGPSALYWYWEVFQCQTKLNEEIARDTGHCSYTESVNKDFYEYLLSTGHDDVAHWYKDLMGM